VPKVTLRNLHWIEEEVLAKERPRQITQDEKCWKFPNKPEAARRRRLCGRPGVGVASRKPLVRECHVKLRTEGDIPAWRKQFQEDIAEAGEDLFEEGKAVYKKGGTRQKTLHNHGYVPRKCGRPTCPRREQSHGQFESCPHCKTAVYCSPRCYKLDWESGNHYIGDKNHSHKAVCPRNLIMPPRANEKFKISIQDLQRDKKALPSETVNPVAQPEKIVLRQKLHTPRYGDTTPRMSATPRASARDNQLIPQPPSRPREQGPKVAWASKVGI